MVGEGALAVHALEEAQDLRLVTPRPKKSAATGPPRVRRGRVAEAIELVASKRDGDGRWPLETRYPGVMPVEIDEGEGRASRWNTLRALRVLDWYSARD